jgi:hypothetical protein
MVDEKGEVKLVDGANVIKARFGQETVEANAIKLSNAIQQKLEKQSCVPKANGTNWMGWVKRFFFELGIGTARTDAERKGKVLAENLKLQKEIQSLRSQLNEEVAELRHRGEGYLKAAQTAGDLFNDAEYFVASKLLRLIRGPKKQ